MPQEPYKIIDRRSSSGYINTSNLLVKAATQVDDRKGVPFLDRDFYRNVSGLGRRTLMSLGRWIYSNFPPIEGAIEEQATFAVSSWVPQYAGRNKAWGDLAEATLLQW